MTILKALPVLYCSFFISLKAVGEVSEIIGNYKKEKKKVTKGLTFILDLTWVIQKQRYICLAVLSAV